MSLVSFVGGELLFFKIWRIEHSSLVRTYKNPLDCDFDSFCSINS